MDHNLLLKKLELYFGFSPSAIKLIRSYLVNRRQFVRIENKSSATKFVHSGVPQGSILGPILFCLFINDIVKCCNNVSAHIYADDTQIYCSRPVGLSEDLVARLNEDLESLSIWARDNRLCLNANKTKALLISQNNVNPHDLPPIIMNNIVVKYESVVTSLGFQINSNLNCIDNTNNIIKKGYYVLRKLWHTARFIPQHVKMKVVRALIVPLITYSSVVYGRLDSMSLNKLQLLLNNSARFVFSKKKFDHISNESIQILNYSISNFLSIRNLFFLFKLIQSRQPMYLFEKLQFARSVRTCNLITPRFNYLPSSRMFFVNAIQLWNSLPTVIRSENNYIRFKLAVLNHFSA